ncbi:hypothetical protein scyTo_0008610 [Scyliorhinus torazame]|uniref:Immunoglobulin V-set domain-containing protein n=1 Tax=Scyliorhinus torazame TaxID=75743 RepID=A0A401PBQ5_SCYTO|nr:hypothetical protein [Scyliorhinus torazame]
MPLSSLCQLTAPKKVDGELGGLVTLNCQYDLLYVSNVKQLCRGYNYYECSVVVSTIEPENGRVSLTDNKIQGIFSITIDDLAKDDGGRYWCVIILMSLFQIRLKTSIDLEVSEEKLSRTVSLYGLYFAGCSLVLWLFAPFQWHVVRDLQITQFPRAANEGLTGNINRRTRIESDLHSKTGQRIHQIRMPKVKRIPPPLLGLRNVSVPQPRPLVWLGNMDTGSAVGARSLSRSERGTDKFGCNLKQEITNPKSKATRVNTSEL